MRTRVKICGITRIEDALAAAQYGADAIGLVFYDKSPRYIAPEKAQEIIDCLPAFVTVVGLFVNHPVARIQEITRDLELDLLQFHGDESPAECESAGHAYVKAVRAKDHCTIADAISDYSSARAILVDSYQAGKFGGTGEAFDWNWVPDNPPVPLVLAGGLTPGNVAQAVLRVNPWAVDVSSGVEVSPGIKSEPMINNFIQEINHADAKR